jgi:hypothetical protein
MIKRSLKVAGVFGLLVACLAMDNQPGPTDDKCKQYCEGVVSGGVDDMNRCLTECRNNGGPPSCSFTGF